MSFSPHFIPLNAYQRRKKNSSTGNQLEVSSDYYTLFCLVNILYLVTLLLILVEMRMHCTLTGETSLVTSFYVKISFVPCSQHPITATRSLKSRKRQILDPFVHLFKN
jgi:hypothetical protein